MKRKDLKKQRLKFLCVFTLTVCLLAGFQGFFNFSVAPFAASNASVPLPPNKLRHQKSSIVQHSSTFQNTLVNQHPFDQRQTPISFLPSFSCNWNEAFPDSQVIQIEAAMTVGIHPIDTRDQLAQLTRNYQLVNITNSPFYVVDDLNHSLPYLVPKAQCLLNDIALHFLDSLKSKGLPPHLPVVSSVLRTTEDVKQLQRGNQNATTNSCHLYGTTIDIAYHRFKPLSSNYLPDTLYTRWNEQLKLVLAEVLYDLRQQGRCFVKYERKQACFHLTVR